MVKIYYLYLSSFILIYSLGAQTTLERKVSHLIETSEKSNTEALIIYKDGELLVEKYFGIGHRDTLLETMSCTKSIVSLGVMAMLEDGLIDSLETPIYHLYPEWNQGIKKQVTIYHLLSMTSGLQNVSNAGLEIYPSPDFVKLALAAEMDDKPGEKFSYNNKALNLLSGIAQKLTNQRLDKYISERLFEPLGIKDYLWSSDSTGNPHVMAGCQIRPKDFGKIGLMVLNNGEYQAKQVLSPESIHQMLNPIEQYKGYGLLWWLTYKEIKYVIDSDILEKLKEAGVSETFLQTLEKMKGEYDGVDPYQEELARLFGDDYRNQIHKETAGLAIRKKLFIGDPIGYNANGYLGNYLVIVPESNVVGVRMISHKSYDWNAETSNSFPEFIELIQNIN